MILTSGPEELVLGGVISGNISLFCEIKTRSHDHEYGFINNKSTTNVVSEILSRSRINKLKKQIRTKHSFVEEPPSVISPYT